MQIRDLRRKKGASIVFLVEEYKAALYRDASYFLQGQADNVATFKNDKDEDFSEIIRKQYEKIKGRVTLKLRNKDQLGTTEVR